MVVLKIISKLKKNEFVFFSDGKKRAKGQARACFLLLFIHVLCLLFLLYSCWLLDWKYSF